MKSLFVAVLFVIACHSTSAPGLYAPQPIDVDRIQRACALEVSCLGPAPISPASSCVTQYELGLATGFGASFSTPAAQLTHFIDCANMNSTCQSVLDCASNNHGPSWCAAHPNPTCDGDILYSCSGDWGLVQTDCAALGLHCRTDNGRDACTDGVTCDPEAPQRCDGSRVVICNANGFELAFDCGLVFPGGVCKLNQNGPATTANCVPASSCSGGNDTCDGKALITCVGGRYSRIDCTQLASHCLIDATGRGTCTPDASDCPENAPDTCVGNNLQICVNGTLKQTSCSSLGLQLCNASTTTCQ